jgi:SAM-dependent methyltransferase
MANRPVLTAEEIWRMYDRTEARLTAPVSERMVELAGLLPGMRVLDLATGRGEPAVVAARRVGPGESVLGVDLSASLLQMARERAIREGVANLELRVSNAESLDGVAKAHFHSTLVRWGLMYMDSPVAALVAARRAMVPRGVLVAAVWAEPERVPYFTLPRRVLERYRPSSPIDPESPGTFRYADPERLHRDFLRGGFTIEHVEELDIPVMEAETGPDLVAWARAFGLTRLLNELPEEIQQAWEVDMVRAAEPLRRDGLVRLGGVTRVVVASSTESSDG